MKDLEIDFMNPATGVPYDTVVFVGENGSGKTTILTLLSDYFNCISLRPFEYIEYTADGDDYRIKPLADGNACFHTRENITTHATENIRRDTGNSPSTMYADTKDLRSYSSVFSKARADFKTSKIEHVSAKALDVETHETDKDDNYTSLKQLLVDIDTQDSREYMRQNKIGRVEWSAFQPTSKMYRFSRAFNKFFKDLNYDRIDERANEQIIYFKKNGQDVEIDKLSTGEKQVVFRGAYLLKNSGRMSEGAVFIDEPELSMHPLWQRKILTYFKDLYRESSTGRQKAQIFFASHSDYVVAEALKTPNENLVVVLKENGGTLTATTIKAPIILPSITSAEINFHAFNVYSTDLHIALFGYLQTLTGITSIQGIDTYIASQTLYDRARHARASSYGTTNYVTLSALIRNHIDHPDNAYTYTEEELKISTDLLIDLIDEWKRVHP